MTGEKRKNVCQFRNGFVKEILKMEPKYHSMKSVVDNTLPGFQGIPLLKPTKPPKMEKAN